MRKQKESPGVVEFTPVDTSTPKDVGIPSKLPRSQSGRPSELSVIEE